MSYDNIGAHVWWNNLCMKSWQLSATNKEKSGMSFWTNCGAMSIMTSNLWPKCLQYLQVFGFDVWLLLLLLSYSAKIPVLSLVIHLIFFIKMTPNTYDAKHL